MANNEKDKQKTKPYKVKAESKNKKVNAKTKNNVSQNKSKKPKAKKTKKGKHPKLMMAIKILLVIFLLFCVIAAGIIAGLFFGLFGNDFEITKDELKIGASNSVVVDKNGAVIANLSGDEKRKIITIEDMAEYLPKAYVAIEDERFYTHDGVDFKRTAGAILNTIVKRSSKYGGSTITQQLVKNITKEDESSGMAGILRKVKEWAKAYQVERMISKNQILELYLNILYVGGEGNLHGVELGAEYYFNKSAKDLTLAECAYMAGINSSPNYYNPYMLMVEGDTEEKRDERIKNKTITVLEKMKELGYITNEEEYNQAVEQARAGLNFQKGTTSTGSVYSYHTDAVISQVIDQVVEEKGISEELAKNYVYSSGLTIYSTVDSTIQARLEEEFKKSKYIEISVEKNVDGTLKNDHTQAGMAVVDYKTGEVLGVCGGLGEKTTAYGWNRATQMKKQTGSSMKPLATVAPGLEEKVITAATIYNDTATKFGTNYTPKNYNGFKGLVNIRSFIATSQNIPAVKIMTELTPEKSLQYLRKMGITSLKDNEDNILALAIGGMRNGVSPLEMAVAYGTIANDGVCVSPTFYTKVTDSNGNVVLTPNQEKTRAISEQNAYITKTILQEPVKRGGTATYCAISGMDVAAKTGTTDDSVDRWLCGFTPYYSAACWYGYDNNETVRSDSNPAGLIWDAVMTDIHKNLPSASFTKPSGIVEVSICKATGCVATTGCTSYKEIFTQDNIPQKCEGHGTQEICTQSGKVANEYCPEKKTNNFGGTVPKEKLNLWKTLSGSTMVGNKVEEVCDIHKKTEEKPKENTVNTNTTNSINTNTTNQNNTTTNSNTNSNTNTNASTNTNTNSNTSVNTNTNTNTNTGSSSTKNDSTNKESQSNKTT